MLYWADESFEAISSGDAQVYNSVVFLHILK